MAIDLPQYRTLSTKPPLALFSMQSIGCLGSADESQFFLILGLPIQGLNPGPSAQQARVLPLDHCFRSHNPKNS